MPERYGPQTCQRDMDLRHARESHNEENSLQVLSFKWVFVLNIQFTSKEIKAILRVGGHFGWFNKSFNEM